MFKQIKIVRPVATHGEFADTDVRMKGRWIPDQQYHFGVKSYFLTRVGTALSSFIWYCTMMAK